MEFKVGDTVIIKSKEEIIMECNNPETYKYMYSFVDDMFRYCNTKYIIKYVDDDYVTFFSNHNYKWHITWIKKDDFFTDEDFLI